MLVRYNDIVILLLLENKKVVTIEDFEAIGKFWIRSQKLNHSVQTI